MIALLALCGCDEADPANRRTATEDSTDCDDLLNDPRLGDEVEVVAGFETDGERSCTVRIDSPDALSELEVVELVCPNLPLVAIALDEESGTWSVDLTRTAELRRDNC